MIPSAVMTQTGIPIMPMSAPTRYVKAKKDQILNSGNVTVPRLLSDVGLCGDGSSADLKTNGAYKNVAEILKRCIIPIETIKSYRDKV